MLVVVASYRQNVHAYPSGGGDYEVATVNLGPTAGLTVASALLVDYVLTVAVSISSGVAVRGVDRRRLRRATRSAVAVVVVLLLMAVNLRGVRESGTAFAIPTYVFMVAILGMALWGFGRYFFGDLPRRGQRAVRRSSRRAGTSRGWPASPAASCCCAPSPPAAPR